MMNPEPSDPTGGSPINRGSPTGKDDLVPGTNIDHLLSDEERRLSGQDRDAIEELGREMDRRLTREVMYPVYYQTAREQLAAGASPEGLRAEMLGEPADTDDFLASILREAYEDALAGRPPRM